MSQRPIALFDSGIGGLHVMQAISACLPNESLVYLGDTARLPYGTKSPAVVEAYAWACARFLLHFQPKMLVIACNTATAYALTYLQRRLPIPVLGVIEPGLQAALQVSRSLKIGLLATSGTVQSQAYTQQLQLLAPKAQLFAVAAPLLVPLAEENLNDHRATYLLVKDYIKPLRQQTRLDTIILGCTHYPLLSTTLSKACGPKITLVNSAITTAAAVQATLIKQQLSPLTKQPVKTQKIFVTDWNERYQQIASRFLKLPLPTIAVVDLTCYQKTG